MRSVELVDLSSMITALNAELEQVGVSSKIILTANRNGQSRQVEAAVVDIGQTATSG